MESSLKILFAGCGDISLRTITKLQQVGSDTVWPVLAMRRNLAKLPKGIDAVAGDVRDSDGLWELLEDKAMDTLVVTLTPTEMSDEGYRDSYVVAAQSIKAAIEKCSQPPSLIIWVSSTGVYGQSEGEWVDELTMTSPASFRGKRLLEAESIIDSLPVASVVVRFSGIYGPGRNRLISQVKRGELASELPVTWTNRIHADDCAGVLAHLLGRFSRGEVLEKSYIATDNKPVPAYEMQGWLANEMGLESGEKAKGSEHSSSKYNSSDMNQSIKPRAGSRRCSNQRLLESGYKFLYPTYREGYRALLKEGTDD
jgi:nucleoside-diphosphate-sugar epimerase